MFRFGKRTAKKEEPVIFDSDKIMGNTAEMARSIRNDRARAAIAAINEVDPNANINPDDLDENDMDYFAGFGFIVELIARGYHADAEDLENLSEAH